MTCYIDCHSDTRGSLEFRDGPHLRVRYRNERYRLCLLCEMHRGSPMAETIDLRISAASISSAS